ncbi:hypothetical protein GGS21DRAFT_402389 [Xylaria nigripes]|nr:hypothetical protein GGS21DRAFT_402389 [Xylaria nigripes]
MTSQSFRIFHISFSNSLSLTIQYPLSLPINSSYLAKTMRFLISLLIAIASLPLALTEVPRPPSKYHWKCFHAGRLWGETRKNATLLARQTCNDTLGNRYYTEMQRARSCFHLAEDLRVDFTAQLLWYPDRVLPAEECFDRMSKLLRCRRGGSFKDNNWFFAADPNEGGTC